MQHLLVPNHLQDAYVLDLYNQYYFMFPAYTKMVLY